MTREVKKSRPDLSIQCCACGGRSVITDVSDWRSRVDNELRQMARVRECRSCGNRWRTLELGQSEVQELRRRAYLWEMSQAKERNGLLPKGRDEARGDIASIA